LRRGLSPRRRGRGAVAAGPQEESREEGGQEDRKEEVRQEGLATTAPPLTGGPDEVVDAVLLVVSRQPIMPPV